MAETLKLPNEVVDEGWRNDVDNVDYAIYGKNEKQEREYVNRAEISKKEMDIVNQKKLNLLKDRGKMIKYILENAKAA